MEGRADLLAFFVCMRGLNHTHAWIGYMALMNRQGYGARSALNQPVGCVISVIVGIVNSLYVESLN